MISITLNIYIYEYKTHKKNNKKQEQQYILYKFKQHYFK